MIRGTKKPINSLSTEEREHLQLDLSSTAAATATVEALTHNDASIEGGGLSSENGGTNSTQQSTANTSTGTTSKTNVKVKAMEPLSIDQIYEAERSTHKVNHWKKNAFAAGLVEPTWSDELRHRRVGHNAVEDANGPNRQCCEDAASEQIDPTCGCLMMSGVICGKLGAGRIGNMVVLKERNVRREVDVMELISQEDEELKDGEGGGDDEESGRMVKANIDQEDPRNDNENGDTTMNNRKRVVNQRQIDLIVGPYWPCLIFVTFPLVIGVSLLTAVKAIFIPNQNIIFVVFWLVLTIGLCFSLFSVGCRDPGLMPKYYDKPMHLPDHELNSWRWNDQAQTFRPKDAVYCPDCAVVVEEFDHTCPWTGTAIGKKNMPAFQAFVGLVFICLIMDIMLLTTAAVI